MKASPFSSTTGKVLETGVLALPESTPRIVGLPTGLVYSTGSYLREEVGSEALMEELQALKIVYEELNANGFTDITYYDVSDTLNIEVMIEDRLLLMLGSENDMAYKVGFIRKVLDAKESGDEEFENVPEEGTLDFSNPPALHTMSISVDKTKMRMPIWTSAPTCRSRATTPLADSSPSRCRLQPPSRQKERSRRSRTPQPVRLARTRGRLMRLPRKRQARQKRPSRRSRSHPRLSKRREQARRLFNLKLQLVHSRQRPPRMGLE